MQRKGSALIIVLALGTIVILGTVFFVLKKSPKNSSQQGIRISSPAAGSTVIAGQTINVAIEPVGDVLLTQANAWFLAAPSEIPQPTTSSPFIISLSVPSELSGLATLQGAGVDKNNKRLQTSIQLQVVRASFPLSIQVDPASIYLAHTGQTRSINVVGTFKDGSIHALTKDPGTSLIITNSRVAKLIQENTTVVAIEPGMSTVIAKMGGLSAFGRIAVGVSEILGDLDMNERVDQSDIDIETKALNTSSTGPGDPRDLNKDGVINEEDIKILKDFCLFPNYTSQ